MAGTAFTIYNIYYESDGGGGNIQFDSLEKALEEYESMIKYYPNSYVCLDVKRSNIFSPGYKVAEFNGRYH